MALGRSREGHRQHPCAHKCLPTAFRWSPELPSCSGHNTQCLTKPLACFHHIQAEFSYCDSISSYPVQQWSEEQIPFSLWMIYRLEDCHQFSLPSSFCNQPVAFKPFSQVIISVSLFLGFSRLLYTSQLGWCGELEWEGRKKWKVAFSPEWTQDTIQEFKPGLAGRHSIKIQVIHRMYSRWAMDQT